MKRDRAMDHWLESPFGDIELRMCNGLLAELRFAQGPCRERLPQAPQAVRGALSAWFDGATPGFEWLAPDLPGTAFQQAVWQALRDIPRGERITYATLAARLERPRAVRAVASAVAANPVLLLLPCHRVVGSDGKLHGYAGGIERKRMLLEMEQASTGGPV